MHKHIHLALLLLAMVSCSLSPSAKRVAADNKTLSRGVYYWRTIFALDSVEVSFLQKNSINKLYVRYFDVDVDEKQGLVPRATIALPSREKMDSIFKSVGLPIEIVPTVYITNYAIKFLASPWADEKFVAEFVGKLANRISAMSSQHGIADRVHEVQFDCDWTASTQDTYFMLCSEFRKQTEYRLSSTIRLHQLRKSVPPVDEGVLMLYNTGDFRSWETRNSIIDYDDVRKYLSPKSTYGIPLSAAYPNYSWEVYFYQNHKFAYLSTNRDGNTTDLARKESSLYEEIMSVKRLVESSKIDLAGNIIYHLDSDNLSKYSDEEISAIYR